MSTDRAHVEASLAVHDAEALGMVLDAANVSRRGAESSGELAARIADALWWNWCTPLGYVAARTSLEDIVKGVARKLRADSALDPDTDGYIQVRALSHTLLGQLQEAGVSLSDLDETTRSRVWPDWLGTLGFASTTTGAIGAGWTSGKVLWLLKTPIGRLLPLIPPVAPWVKAIHTGARAVYVVAGPLGLALGVLTVNNALGANYHRLVPLLLGVGALGPSPVDEADEVD